MNENTITWSEVEGVVTLTLDDPSQSVNTMRTAYVSSMDAALARLRALAGLRGVMLSSAKKTFFAGGDLHELLAVGPEGATELALFTASAKAQLRELETLGVPVVAVINGHALGGGLELALAAHHRIVADDPQIRLGLPEVGLGLLPGGGGVVRTVRLLGLDTALDRLLLTGATFSPTQALELGLVDDVAPADQLVARALRWIAANPDALQPWDAGAGIPGGSADVRAVELSLPLRAAKLRAQHGGAPMPAHAAILAAAVESTQVDLASAFDIETRYFVELVVSPIAKNIIKGGFFDRKAVAAGASRPPGHQLHEIERMAVIGAGLMGAGIALTAAQAGIEVRVKDTDLEAARRAKAYADKALAKQVERGSRTAAQAAEVLARIHPVAEIDEIAGVQLVVEAVFEDAELKAQVFAELSKVTGDDALIASNTSTLPISGLAASVDRPGDFVGMHFFSPVERMELVEIIVGERTSEETLAKAFDIARQLKKTPVVVGDGRGFFTSRVILGRLLEAAAMLSEGIPAPSIEQASRQAGYPLGTLALTDDISLSLAHTIYGQMRDEALRDGNVFVEHPGARVLGRLVEHGRRGRASGSGYYDYREGRRAGLWDDLETEFGPSAPPDGLRELQDRLLFVEALETARCLESGLLRTTADANTGSLLGIGYPRWTGGAAQFVAGYPGGVPAFVRHARDLAQRHGPRFLPPDSLSDAVLSDPGEDLAHA